MFGISAFAETSFSTLGKIGGIVLASAQVDANAIVTANANAIKPFNSWVLDTDKVQWKAPVDYPTDDKRYTWDENTTSWKELV